MASITAPVPAQRGPIVINERRHRVSSFPIGDIKANPFRDLARYPHRKEKVAALVESITATGFWGNIVARVRQDGKAELAFGHHRLQALWECVDQGVLKRDVRVPLIIRDLSDTEMLKIMSRENLEEWTTDAAILLETVRAIVCAYAEGKAALPEPNVKSKLSKLRYAPEFTPGLVPREGKDRYPYTATAVGYFLGWLKPDGKPQNRLYTVFEALELIEAGVVNDRDFRGMSLREAKRYMDRIMKERQIGGRRKDCNDEPRPVVTDAVLEALLHGLETLVDDEQFAFLVDHCDEFSDETRGSAAYRFGYLSKQLAHAAHCFEPPKRERERKRLPTPMKRLPAPHRTEPESMKWSQRCTRSRRRPRRFGNST